MLLFYTGKNRKSGKIQEGFKNPSEEQIQTLLKIKEITYDGIKAMASKDIKKVGELLECMWELKKKSNKGVTNPDIDNIYEKAKNNGALGFKLSGAGGGGHFVVICKPEDQERLIKSMNEIGVKNIHFSIDYNGLDVRKIE